jgi:hypothetical protein
VLTKDVVDVLVEFWTNETRVSINKKDIMKHYIMKNIWEKHATHFLKKPQEHVFPFFNLIVCNVLIMYGFLLNCSWLFVAFGFVVGQIHHF